MWAHMWDEIPKELELKALAGDLPENTLFHKCPACDEWGLTNDDIRCQLCGKDIPNCAGCGVEMVQKEDTVFTGGGPLCEECGKGK